MNHHPLQKCFRMNLTLDGWQQTIPYRLEHSQSRYIRWLEHNKTLDLLPSEHLLPRIECPCPMTLPPFMSKADTIEPTDALRALRDTLAPWGFWYKLAPGIATKKLNIRARNRITCRSHLITDTVTTLLGQRIGQIDMLDIGCHNGFFAMDFASRGVKHVTGLELRRENIHQGKFLQQHYDIPNITYHQGDIASWQPGRQYDVVLNLGLLYHVIDPFVLMQHTYEWCRDFAVIDTVCHKEPVSAYIAAFNKDTSLRGEGTHTAELHPTYRALIDTMLNAGFVDLLELVAVPGNTEGRVSSMYRDRIRRCIIGFKRPMREVLRDSGVI